jgi:hypothetical protein
MKSPNDDHFSRIGGEMARSRLANDVDHYDALTQLRGQLFGLRCAINGADIASDADRDGLRQLVSEVIQSLIAIRAAFASERAIQA